MTMNRFTFEFKLFLVNEVIREKKTIRSVAKENGVIYGTLEEWLRKYRIHGEDALRPWHKRYQYSEETRVAAVEEVLHKGASKQSVVRKYNLSSTTVLLEWIAKYNKGKNPKRKGSSLMTNKKSSKNTTLNKRLEIVQYALAAGTDYQAAAVKYGVSYQQVYNWVKKYQSSGVNGLQDRRGHNQFTKELSELDQLRIENKKLRDRNQLLEMEQDFTKKLQELRRRFKTSL